KPSTGCRPWPRSAPPNSSATIWSPRSAPSRKPPRIGTPCWRRWTRSVCRPVDTDGPAHARHGLLRGMDRAAFAVALSSRLRRAGMPVDLTATATLVDAFRIALPRSRHQLYWACRIALVRRHDEVAIFDRVFEAVFADAVLDM